MFDMTQGFTSESVTVGQDFVFAVKPLSADEIVEGQSICGSSDNAQSVGGSVEPSPPPGHCC